MAFDVSSGTATAAQVAAGAVNLIAGHQAAGFSERKLTLRNNTTVTITIIVYLQDPTNELVDMLVFTITTNGIAIVTRGVGFASSFGGLYTRTNGNEAAIDGPATTITIQVSQNAGAAGGNVIAELVQQG